jgi:hypothetical protein
MNRFVLVPVLLLTLGAIAQVLHYLHAGTKLDPRYPLLVYAVQFVFMAPYLAFLWLTGGIAVSSVRSMILTLGNAPRWLSIQARIFARF